MSLRMKAQLANSSLLAKALEENPNVRHVYHPSLESHPQHNLAERIFTNGYGTMMSFRVEDDRAKVDEFVHRLKIVKYLGTLGGIKTSIAHPASAFRNEFTPDELIKMGLYEGLIRISTGAEDINDLINDFSQALETQKSNSAYEILPQSFLVLTVFSLYTLYLHRSARKYILLPVQFHRVSKSWKNQLQIPCDSSEHPVVYWHQSTIPYFAFKSSSLILARSFFSFRIPVRESVR